MNRRTRHPIRQHLASQQSTHRRQRGAVVVLVAIAMVALLAMAGLALDGGHLLLNKTRLQNAVDASALSAARTMADFPSDTAVGTVHAAAEAAALATFLSNLGLTDNGELNDAYATGTTPLLVEFSTTLNPFTPEATALPYVRVIAQDLQLEVWLMQVVGLADKPVSASAVAGPIGLDADVCKVLPIMVCGCDSKHIGDPADDCPGAPDDSYYGYPQNPSSNLEGADDITVVKLAGGDTTDVGPGNFRLLRLGDATGGNDLRDALAGRASQCVTIGEDSTADTEPGNKAGPVRQGMNTRILESLNESPDYVTSTYWSGATAYSPINPNPLELKTDDSGQSYVGRKLGGNDISDIFDYQDYRNAYSDGGYACEGNGDGVTQCGRREIALPIGQCDSGINGTSEDVRIYSVGCFFLLQEVGSGNEAQIFGQFFADSDRCSAVGSFDSDSDDDSVPIKIVLFRDADSGDS